MTQKPPPGGGAVTITNPQDNDILGTSFTVTGTYDGITLPVVTYYPDRDDANTTTVGTTAALRGGVWQSEFSHVPCSNGNCGRITADTALVDKLTVTDK
jgi:hypothetical protein